VGKVRTVDTFFKQALLSKSITQTTPQSVHIIVPEVQSHSGVSESPSPSEVTDSHSTSDITDDNEAHVNNVQMVPDQRLFCLPKYEQKYTWLYYSSAKGGYCCKLCELFSTGDFSNVFFYNWDRTR